MRRLSDHCSTLGKAAKRHTDLLADLGRSHKRWLELLDSQTYFKIDKTEDYVHQRARVTLEGMHQLHKVYAKNARGALDEPLKKYIKMFAGVSEEVRAYERAASELEKARERVSRQAYGDPAKRDKAERQLYAAEGSFNAADAVLPGELVQVHNSRWDFFDPMLEALIEAEARLFAGLEATTDTIVGTEEAEGLLDEQDAFDADTHRLLAEIEALSIVGGAD